MCDVCEIECRNRIYACFQPDLETYVIDNGEILGIYWPMVSQRFNWPCHLHIIIDKLSHIKTEMHNNTHPIRMAR